MPRLAFILFLLIGLSAGHVSAAQKRERPDYDGRGGEPTTVGDVLLWGPRIVLFPAYVVTEYGFRQPLRWLGRTAELNNLPFLVADFFKFGEDRQFALYPTALVDFGFRASFGFQFRWKGFLAPNNRLTLRAATGGTDYGIVKLTDELRLDGKTVFRLSGEIGRRPDLIFHSMGPLTEREARFRYAASQKEAALAVTREEFLGGRADLQVSVRDYAFSNGNCCDEPGIETGINAGLFTAPPRYPGGYSSFAQRLHVNWGGIPSRPKDRLGAILDVTGDHSFDFKGGGWWIYGGALTGYLDLNGLWRVLALRVEADWSDPHGGSQVPFNEFPSIGDARLPGFLSRRFIGESAFATTLEYRWPVLSLIDGVVHFGVGNVFGRNLAGLKWGWLRKSIGFGLEGPFGLLVAFGSRPFDEGGDFNEFRFSLRFGIGGS